MVAQRLFAVLAFSGVCSPLLYLGGGPRGPVVAQRLSAGLVLGRVCSPVLFLGGGLCGPVVAQRLVVGFVVGVSWPWLRCWFVPVVGDLFPDPSSLFGFEGMPGDGLSPLSPSSSFLPGGRPDPLDNFTAGTVNWQGWLVTRRCLSGPQHLGEPLGPVLVVDGCGFWGGSQFIMLRLFGALFFCFFLVTPWYLSAGLSALFWLFVKVI